MRITNTEIKINFSIRLKYSLIKNQYHGNSVHVKKLSTITGNSTQVCRKYLKGIGLPDLVTIIKISQTLHVSPNWLMFGENVKSQDHQLKKILISKNMLHYIYEKYFLFLGRNKNNNIDNMADFFSHITNVISLTEGNDDALKELIDTFVSSIQK